jgi:aspartate/methionine/tyrosine aminotransferase
VAGSAFGGDNHIRISFACSRENLAEGFRRIQDFLARG